MWTGLGGDFSSRSIIRSASHWELDFEIVQTNLLSYQTKQAFDLVICIMVLTSLPDSQIADAIEKLQSMTSMIARKTSSNDV
jgi:trans-aconitate methyltransferase